MEKNHILLDGLEGFLLIKIPKKNNKSERRHDKLVKELESQLEYSHKYDSLWTFLEYKNNNLHGEIDLLGVMNGLFDFYEIKCTDCYKSRKRANEQYLKFKLAFPNLTSRGFMYDGNSTRTI